MKTSRDEVYKAIDSERDYQDSQWPNGQLQGEAPNANPLKIGEFVLLMSEYVDRARHSWSTEKAPELETLNFVRKVAGIAVNCMEQHGAPKRITDALLKLIRQRKTKRKKKCSFRGHND